MKKLIILLVCLLPLIGSAQTYQVDKSGNIQKVQTQVKQPDKVYKIVDGVTFYQGAKGGIYYWRKSKKTGKEYKCYVKSV